MTLPTSIDPAGMYTMTKLSIYPRLARLFFKETLSSAKQPNSTHILSVAERDPAEKIGNVSMHVELWAFNTNYSRFISFP